MGLPNPDYLVAALEKIDIFIIELRSTYSIDPQRYRPGWFEKDYDQVYGLS